jgi:hypothetical protein
MVMGLLSGRSVVNRLQMREAKVSAFVTSQRNLSGKATRVSKRV